MICYRLFKRNLVKYIYGDNMKKGIRYFLIMVILLIPFSVRAGISSTLECEDLKVDANNMAYKTCTMKLVVDSNSDNNAFDLKLTLENLVLTSYKLENGWKMTHEDSNNLSIETVKANLTEGNYTVGTLTFYKILSASVCDLHYSYTFKKIVRNCVNENNLYYGPDGAVITDFEFKRKCETHKCTILQQEGTKYYFDDTGAEVGESTYNEKCNAKHYCEKVEEVYYGPTGEATNQKDYELNCVKHYCEKYDEENYFGKNGNKVEKLVYEKECIEHTCEKLEDDTKYGKYHSIVDDLTYQKQCGDNKCVILSDNTHYGINGTVVDDLTYKAECETVKCMKINDKYYDNNGKVVTEDEYNKSCGTVENPKTGLTIPIILTSIITILGISGLIIIKKYNKFM